MDTSVPAGRSPRRSSALVIRGLLLALIIFLGFLGLWHAVSALVDRDIDGFVAIEFGGDDCVDSYMSSYSSALPACNPAVSPTFLESKPDPDSDDDIADHAWMRDAGGLFHLYFQNEDQGTGDDIEQYTSSDLKSLTYVGLALQKNPAGWDSYGLWAPDVVFNPSDGLYYLFYAGTTGGGSNPTAKQRIGVATSPDLITWTKAPVNNCSGTNGDGCVYECDEPWTQWNNGGSYDAQCRDPFVIWDPQAGQWVLFTTVQMDEAVVGGPWTQGVSVATSPDLLTWTGAGYIKAAKRLWSSEGGTGAQLTGGIAENPIVTVYDGTYYLFFTDSNDPEDYWYVPNPRTEVQYLASPSLAADPGGSANWTYRGATQDPGVNAAEIQVVDGDTWIVTHSIVPNSYSGYWYSHVRDLRVKRIIWNTDGTFTTSNLTNLDCRVPSGQINPAVPELCGDGLDNDCANGPDDALTCGVCTDVDRDGYGTSEALACTFPGIDCNDANAAIHPGATEYCEDGLDNDCNGQTDEPSCTLVCLDDDGDGYGHGGFAACDDPTPDCNDADWNVNPGVPEYCSDTVDNNCNGQVDEAGCTEVCVDVDGDGYGASGYSACPSPEPDCNDEDEFANPGMAEQCSDSVDNNCDTQIDEPLCVGVCVDGDSDGYGSSGLLSCPTTTPDCNDAQSSVHPGAIERCDSYDNNCDGRTNENGVCRKTRRIEWTVDGEIWLGH